MGRHETVRPEVSVEIGQAEHAPNVYNPPPRYQVKAMTNRTPSPTACPACSAPASGNFCSHCGATISATSCAQCSAPLAVGARFCQACGAEAGGGGGGGNRSDSGRAARLAGVPAARSGNPDSVARYVPWAIAALLLIMVVSYLIGSSTSTPLTAAQGGAPDAPFALGGGPAGQAPDIASMSPRERASRLYDRIMRYVEEGKRDSLQFFAPMAMGSFELLGTDMDVDARYDYGRVASEVGELELAAAQADTILQQAPTHLLGLSLAARVATLRGNSALATRMWQQFLSVRESELKKNLPEVQAHATDIELATTIAKGGS